MHTRVALCLLLLFSLFHSIMAQFGPKYNTDSLHLANGMRMVIRNDGSFLPFYFDPSIPREELQFRHGLYHYKDKRQTFICAGSLWIGGIDNSGELRTAAQTYNQSGNDYRPGIINAIGGADTSAMWTTIYSISRETILAFRADFAREGRTVLERFSTIRDWPGSYTVTGELRQFAPYIDLNSNQRYEPELGEYPAIRGDHMFWWVVRNNGDIGTESGSKPMDIEAHHLAYVFLTDTLKGSPDLTRNIFYHTTIVNRSEQNYKNCFAGIWTDYVVGELSNKFVGCDTVRHFNYAYNSFKTPDSLFKGFNVPVVGMKLLRGLPADGPDDIDNNHDGQTDEPNEPLGLSRHSFYLNDFSAQGNPADKDDFYGYLRGQWKDGSSFVDDRLVGNGNGYAETSEPKTMMPSRFLFYDYPFTPIPKHVGYPPADPSQPWSMLHYKIERNDQRALSSMGPFSLAPKEVKSFEFCYTWSSTDAADTSQSRATALAQLFEQQHAIDSLFKAGGIISSRSRRAAQAAPLLIYPNPVRDQLDIQLRTGQPAIQSLTILNAVGQTVWEASSNNPTQFWQIDTSILPAGIYVVRWTDKDGLQAAEKIVKE
jgi:hypothetical protein